MNCESANIAAAFEDCHSFICIGRVKHRITGVFDRLSGFHSDDRFILDDQHYRLFQYSILGSRRRKNTRRTINWAIVRLASSDFRSRHR